IPESVTTIGVGAFQNCTGLTSVTIPESVDTIGFSEIMFSSAFTGCTSISSPLYNSKIFAYMPKDYSGEYVIPSGIQSIVPYAFVDCQGPISVTIPNSMTAIGSSAFSGCSGLTSVTIPEGVTSIGYQAFSYCSGLTTVKLPESVDTIRGIAFLECENLLSVTSLSRTPPYCESSVFSVYGTLYVPYGCKTAYQTAQEWYKFIRIEELPSAGTATVTVNVNDASMGTVVGGGKYELGEQAMLAAIPNKDCYFDHWNDGNTSNPRILTVKGDTTFTAVFAKYGSEPTANEASEADNLRVYVQNRTIYLSEDKGLVQVYNTAGQCLYNGHATTIPVQQGGVYIVRVGARSYKIMVR
ncbi:MAG: leucine-rich repeat domain-containing protein, partial [Bacteroidales bacterium]|nr:leucine-rich repeat domain-containing protein [Bacteroidales bacterium]